MSYQSYDRLYNLLYKQKLYTQALFVRYIADRLHYSSKRWDCGPSYLKELRTSYRKTNIDWYINI